MALALVVGLVPIMAAPALATITPLSVTATPNPNTVTSTAQYTIVWTSDATVPITGTVTVTFPSDTTVPATISKSTISIDGVVLTLDPTVVGRAVTMQPITALLAGTHTVVISQLAGIKNPSVGGTTYTTSVATGAETAVASTAYTIIRTLSRSPSSGVRGTAFTVSGVGWAKATTANLTVGGVLVGSGLVAADGTFSAAVVANVPPFAAGSTTITVTDGAGNATPTTSFTVNRSITLSPTSGRPPATITVTGRDWVVGDSPILTTTVAGAGVTMTPASPTITLGAFSFTFPVPAGLAGDKTVVVTGTAANTASATLTVLGSPVVSSPTSGVIGTRVTLTGTGFTPLGTITTNTITLGAAAFTHPTVNIDSGGNFLVALTLSGAALEAVAASPGTYTIAVSDGTLSGVANFTVPAASITLSTASSVVGSSVVVRGVGFPANAVAAFITYGLATVGMGIVDSTGNFAAAITVPSTATIPSTNIIAAYAITANGTTVPPTATPAQATHSVPSAAITLSATSGNPGSTLRITGTGFPAYAVVGPLTIGGINALPSPAPATDGFGNVTANVIVPALASGPAVVAITVGPVTGSVAFTITTTAITPAVALAGIAGSYSRVWGYDNTTKAWKLFDPAVPAISDLTVLARGQGYWINCTQAATLVYGANQYVLNVGWNLIGWLD